MRIVCDVSTTLAWTRPAVGIVRTEQKFVRFLLDRPDLEVVFCRFDRSSRQYVEVCRDLVLAGLVRDPAVRVEGGEHANRNAAPPAPRALRLRIRAWAAGLTRRGIGHLPDVLQPDATLIARSTDQLIRSVYWLGLKAGHAVQPGRLLEDTRSGGGNGRGPIEAEAEAAAAAVDFQASDVYVSMGLDWDYNDLTVLWECKRTQGFRTLLFCYDVIPVSYPQLMASDCRDFFAAYFVNLAHVADHVVTISQATLNECLAFLAEIGAPTPPMSVVHLGTEVQEGAERDVLAPPRPELTREPFVLCVGTIEARKNHELLYHLWDRLIARHGERIPHLVLVGMVGWGVQDLLARLRINPRLSARVFVLDCVTDEELLWLYRHCRFSVFPSFCEGWGLPVVESMALGKVCIVSTAPALLEASQGLVPAIDPLDFGAWFAVVERYVLDPETLAQTEAKVRDCYAPMSWRRHGEEMLRVIHGLEGTEACASSI